MNDELASLAEYHREHFQLGDAAVAFNKDQRIVVIGQRITPEIRQTAAFLCSKGARVTCVEFTFFRSQEGSRLMSQENCRWRGIPAAGPGVIRVSAFCYRGEVPWIVRRERAGSLLPHSGVGQRKDHAHPLGG